MSNQNGTHRPGFAAILNAAAAADHGDEAQAWLEESVTVLETALRSYQMVVQTLDFRLTPNAALVRLKGNDGITVERVEKRIPTLLTSWGLEIIAVRAGRGHIMVMIAREVRSVVPTARLWLARDLPATCTDGGATPRYNTSFVIGEREDTGALLYANLAHPFGGQPVSGPHILIAGESGSGKGVLTSNLMLEICATNDPAMAQLVVIDPKSGVDYAWIEKTPHLRQPIVVDQEESLIVYDELMNEMERRYADLLGPTRSRDLDAYNARPDATERLPRIYVVHDEMADWMGDHEYRNEAGAALARLSAKGRAAGIHLILVTQRPDKNAIPGRIKANIANRIALRVSSKVNSNIILDETGAEALLGQGHMLAIVGGVQGGPVYAQAPYLDPWDAEILADSIADDLGADASAPAATAQPPLPLAA